MKKMNLLLKTKIKQTIEVKIQVYLEANTINISKIPFNKIKIMI